MLALVEPEALLADKGYDADGFIASLTARAIKAVIPPKSNRKVKRDRDFALCRERNLVERFFRIIRDRDTLREDRAKLPRWPAPGLRPCLA